VFVCIVTDWTATADQFRNTARQSSVDENSDVRRHENQFHRIATVTTNQNCPNVDQIVVCNFKISWILSLRSCDKMTQFNDVIP